MKWEDALNLLENSCRHLNDDEAAEINAGDLRLAIKTFERWHEEASAKQQEDKAATMDLTNPTALSKALMQRYPSTSKLAEVVEEHFNWKLDWIVAPGPYETVAFKFVQWVQAHGHTSDLLQLLQESENR